VKATLKLPRVSMNMEEGTITAWHKAPGEAFAAGEALYAVETEKVTTEIEAPCDGTLLEILVPEGEDADVGAPVCRIEPS
jgi:pyruvate/2-oxoglutarate dehydrogenase complex dihydrolipoamide acyltransferase (E2) component